MKQEEISELLKRVGAKPECPVCGKDQWYGTGADGQSVLFFPLKKVDEEHLGSVPTLTLFCENCAYIRQHALMLLKKRSEKSLGDNDDEHH